MGGLNVRDELLTRARNLERYPFESATMAEAGRLAAAELRKIAKQITDAQTPSAESRDTQTRSA